MHQEPLEAAVAVTGAGGTIGRRVVAALRAVVGRVVEVDPTAPDLKRVVEGIDTVVHLSSAVGDGDEAAVARNVAAANRVLDAASAVGVSHVVLLSSAAVYGAWPNNPVPLTEDAPVRPNPGFAFGAEKAEVERLTGEWSDEHPGATVAVLRPAVPLGEEEAGFLATALGVGAPVATGDPDVPVQFVHLDDLTSAVVHATVNRLDGVFNVAADGWLQGSAARALAGAPPRLRLPDRAMRVVARVGRSSPGLGPYTLHPWVVATDRLKATGWSPIHTNEETVVETTEGMPWSRLTPKRRQELAMAGSVVGLVGLLLGAFAIARRIRARSAGRY